MLRLMTPPMSMLTERKTLVTLTAKPVCEKSVLNKIPRLSPQLTIAKPLNATMKYSDAVRCRPAASTVSTAKSSAVRISKGISARVYCRKKASTP